VDVTDEAFSADDFELIEGKFTFKIDEVAPYVECVPALRLLCQAR